MPVLLELSKENIEKIQQLPENIQECIWQELEKCNTKLQKMIEVSPDISMYEQHMWRFAKRIVCETHKVSDSDFMSIYRWRNLSIARAHLNALLNQELGFSCEKIASFFKKDRGAISSSIKDRHMACMRDDAEYSQQYYQTKIMLLAESNRVKANNNMPL